MSNIIKIPKIYKKILILFVLFLLLFVNQSSIFAASGTSCYIPIPNKPGCSGLNTINDVKHKGQLKCFTIDKKAKDCGVFVNVLPTDTSQGLDTGLDILNCTGSNKNTPECASYCYNNPNTSPSECIDCNSLTPSEKASYSYCQDEESAKWCDFIASDGNGTGWPKTLAGVENAIGTCLDGYEIDVETGAPRRNCLEGGIWSSPSVLCISAKCHAIQETAGKTYANGYAIWPETNKNTSNIQGTCVQDYKQASAGLNPSRSCNNKGQWQEVNNHCIPITCPTLYDAANNVQWNEAIPGSNSSVQAGGVCDVGYEAASGQYPIRLCNRNGTWGDVVVECVIKQCNNSELNTLNPLSNSEYNYSSLGISPTGKSSYGITLIGNCSTGYEKSNPGSTISATCNSNGEWNFIPSSDNGLCQIKTCSISSATSTANISNISSSAAWTLCSDSSCSSTSTTYASSSSTTLNYGSYIKFNACNTGYSTTGSTILQCTETNTWSVVGVNNGACIVQCTWSALNTLTYSSPELSSSKLIETANTWYNADGNNITKPTSSTTYYNSGTVYQIGCPTGYAEITKKKITCNTGTWSTTTADVCSPNACSTATLEAYKTANLPALANITIIAGDTIASGLNKSYTCNAGYSGSIVLSCSAGSVTGYTGSCAMQTCTISSATSMAAISNMSSSSSAWTLCSDSSCLSTSTVYPASSSTTLNYGSYIKFNACNTGYVKGGSTILQCTGINTWSFVGASSGVCNITCTKTALNSKVSSVAGSVLYQANPLFGMYGTSYKSDMSIDISHTGSQSSCNYVDKSNSQYFANATFIEATCNGNYLETGNTVSGVSDYSGNQRPIPLTTPNTGHHYYCENGSWRTVGGCTLRCPTFDSSSYNGTFTATNGACSDGTSSDLCPGATRTLNSCNSGYVKDGNLVITCNSSGAWVASGGGFCGRNCVNASLATGSMFVRVTATDYCPEPDISLTETVYSQGTASADHGQYGYSAMLRNLVRANGSQPGEGFACFVDFQVRALCYNGSFTGFCLSYKSAVAVYESGSCGGNCSNSWPSGGYCN